MTKDPFQRSTPISAIPAAALQALADALEGQPADAALAPIMVTSVGRSGSTLMMRWLAAHPAIVADKTYPLESTFARQGLERITQDLLASRSGDMATVAARTRQTVSEIAQHYLAVHQSQGGQNRPRYYAEKNLAPEWLARLVSPAAKEIFLVRDPRDMICSSLAFNAKRGYQAFGRQDVTSDLEYIAHRAAMALPWVVLPWKERCGDALLVRYEDMVDSPQATLTRILTFLDLDHDAQTVREILEQVAADETLRSMHATASDVSSSVGRWRSELSREMIAACEDAFGEYLATFHYHPDERTERSTDCTGNAPQPPLRVLYVLDPYFDLNDPGIMQGWLHWFGQLDAALTRADPDYAGAVLGFDASIPEGIAGFSGGTLVLDQHALRLGGRLDGIPRYMLDRCPEDTPAFMALIEDIRARLGSFAPSVIMLLGEATWLRRAFPEAAHVNIEVSWLFRAPYPAFWSLDPCGWGKGRVLEAHPEVLVTHRLTPADENAVDRFSHAARNALARSPAAGEWVGTLRARASRIVLLPLAERFALDGRTPVMAALDAYLSDQTPGTIHIITEHPLDLALTLRERTYLERHDNVVFPPQHEEIDTQHLIPLVDAVIGDFSSVSLQALFFDVAIVSLIDSLPYADALFLHRNPIARLSASASPSERRVLLHWLLTHYSIDESRLFDGEWLRTRLRLAISQRKDPAAQFSVPILPSAELAEHPWVKLSYPDILSEPSPADAMRASDRTEYARADKLMEMGDSNHAERILEALCDRETLLWEPYNDLASIVLQRGDGSRCLSLLEKAIVRESPPGLAHRNLAAVQLALGHSVDGIATLGTILRHQPHDQEILASLRDAINQAGTIDPITWARLVSNLRAGLVG